MKAEKRTTLVVNSEAVSRAACSGASRPIFGIARPAEGVFQILSDRAEPGVFTRVGRVHPTRRPGLSLVALTIADQKLFVEVDGIVSTPDEVLILSGSESIGDRRRGLVPEDGLGRFRVDIFGGGSLGGGSGLLLAQAGVGHIRVYDKDRFDTPNLTRHICDMKDLGREKSVALAEKLSLHGVDAIGVTTDVTTLSDQQLDLLLKGSDLLLATMDSPHAQFVVNEAAIRNKIPAVFAGAFELACGGEIVVVRPGSGPCLFCAAGFRTGVLGGVQLAERRQAYQDAEQNKLEAEPGLGADIAYVSSVAAAYALAVLDPNGCRSTLLRNGHAFTLVHGGSQPRDSYAELFRVPFDVIDARVVRDEPCPVCGYQSPTEVAS